MIGGLLFVLVLIFVYKLYKSYNDFANDNNLILKMKLYQKNDLSYSRLTYSNCKYKLLKIFKKKRKLLFCEKTVFDNKDFLLEISEFIDNKNNFCKQKFRGVKRHTYIEYIAEIVIKKFFHNNNFKVINFLKKQDVCCRFQKKEIAILKVVISKYLIRLICYIECEIDKIFKIIYKSKTAKYIKKYRKTIYKYTSYYSICKFNSYLKEKLQTKVLSKNIHQGVCSFIKTIYMYEILLKKSILYLKLFFE